jgi:hypothetical protein
MERKKVIGVITSKEYQKLSNNYKLKIITSDKQELFFYSQQKHQGISQELTVNEKHSFYLFKGKKYWFLESWEKAEETTKENCVKEQVIKNIRESNSEEEVFLEYLEQFTNLLLIKHLSIKDKQEHQLTEKEKKEREILDKIVVNWFYKTSQ